MSETELQNVRVHVAFQIYLKGYFKALSVLLNCFSPLCAYKIGILEIGI